MSYNNHIGLKLFCVALYLIPGMLMAQGTDDIDTLSNLTIEDTRTLFRGILDMRRLSHSVAVGRIAKDQRLADYVEGFMERNIVDVFTIAYIDSDQFWPNVFKNWSLKKLSQQHQEKLLSAEARFIPKTSGGKVVGYKVDLELEGRSNQVFELLQIENTTLEAIVGAVNADDLPDNFKTPSDAKETVISALIYALEQTEKAMGETMEPESEVLIASDYRIRYQGNDYETGAILVINEEERPVQLELVHKDGNVIPEELVVSWSPESISADGRKASLNFKELTSSEPLSISASLGDVDLKAKIINGSKIVSIEEMEEPFYAGIDNNTLKIKYAIDAPSELELKYVKLEVFDNKNILVYSNENDMRITRGGLFEWDGKMNVGPYANQYIRNDQSEFEVRVTVSAHESFLINYQFSTKKGVDPDVDEWNDYESMQGWVLCETCSETERFETYKAMKSKYEFGPLFFTDESVLEYFKNNITFDTAEEKYTFLCQSVHVHKNFYPVLKEVEKNIKNSYGSGVLNRLCSIYSDRYIGGLSIRTVNTGNSKSFSISPHGLGLGIDIDPKRNPQLVYNERKIVFLLLKRSTGVDFNPGASKPGGKETKTAHDLFLQNFSFMDLSRLEQKYKNIQTYNSNPDVRYPINELKYGIIDKDLRAFQLNVLNFVDQVNHNGNSTLLSQLNSIENQLIVLDENIRNIKITVLELYNSIVFSSEGKAAIRYLVDDYFPQIQSKLSELEKAINSFEKNRQSSTNSFKSFISTRFNIDKAKATNFIDEYNGFLKEAKSIKASYSNLETFGFHLKKQILGIGFNNVILKDGFCDLEHQLLEAILSETMTDKFTEWGGHYNNKKDWMHFGINKSGYSEYLIK